MARRYDPDRRQRIIDAAIRVVGDRGIDRLSHRAVAAEADVPLGSTTYHFAGLDELLCAALEQANDSWLAEWDAWERALPPGAPFAEELAAMLEESLTGDRSRVTLEYELYFAALRHPGVRPLAAGFLDRFTALLRRRTPDDATARALAGLLDGLTIQLLLSARPYRREEIAAMLARVVE